MIIYLQTIEKPAQAEGRVGFCSGDVSNRKVNKGRKERPNV